LGEADIEALNAKPGPTKTEPTTLSHDDCMASAAGHIHKRHLFQPVVFLTTLREVYNLVVIDKVSGEVAYGVGLSMIMSIFKYNLIIMG
jgi:hypothetical protein